MPFGLRDIWNITSKYIYSSGRNIGIETKDPKYELDVNGTINGNKFRENGELLRERYLLVSDRDKNTDMIVTNIQNQYDDTKDDPNDVYLLARYRFDATDFLVNSVEDNYSNPIASFDMIPKYIDSTRTDVIMGNKYIIGDASAYFDSNQYFVIDNSTQRADTDWQDKNEITIMMWIRFTQAGIENKVTQQVFEFREFGEYRYYFGLTLEKNKFVFHIKSESDSTEHKYYSNKNIDFNKWYHIALVMYKSDNINQNRYNALQEDELLIELLDLYRKRPDSETNYIRDAGFKFHINGIEQMMYDENLETIIGNNFSYISIIISNKNLER